MTVTSQTDSPVSVLNYCVIEEFGGVFVLSLCFLEFSMGVRAFVVGLSRISFFSLRSNAPIRNPGYEIP